jgi:hypothetical protein
MPYDENLLTPLLSCVLLAGHLTHVSSEFRESGIPLYLLRVGG